MTSLPISDNDFMRTAPITLRPIMRSPLLFWAMAVAIAVLPATALAQGEADAGVEASDEPTHGFAAGNFVFYPGVFLQFDYDSNLFFEDSSEFSAQRTGGLTDAFLMTAGATLRIESVEEDATQLNADVSVGWEQYFNSDILGLSGIEADLGLSALFSPRSSFAWGPRVLYTRTNQPQNNFTDDTYNGHIITPGIEFSIQPGGGAVFQQSLAYDVTFSLFEQVEEANKMDHRIQAMTRWNFFPQTALIFKAEQHIIQYFTGERSVQAENTSVPFALANQDSTPIRLMAGISGLFLRRLDISALVGYAYTAYGTEFDQHLPVAQVNIGYKWSRNAGVRAGYQYNFTDSVFGDFFTFHRGSLGANVFFVPELELDVEFMVDGRTFSGALVQPGQAGPREDVLLRANARLAYTLFNQLDLSLNYQFISDMTDFEYIATLDGGAQVGINPSFNKHIVFLNVAYEF